MKLTMFKNGQQKLEETKTEMGQKKNTSLSKRIKEWSYLEKAIWKARCR